MRRLGQGIYYKVYQLLGGDHKGRTVIILLNKQGSEVSSELTHRYLHLFARVSRVIGGETAKHSKKNRKKPMIIGIQSKNDRNADINTTAH